MTYFLKRKGTSPKGARRVQPGTENNGACIQSITNPGYFSDSISAMHISYPLTTAQVEECCSYNAALVEMNASSRP